METMKCPLCAPVETREYLWILCEEYTLFINQLIRAVINSQDFEKWVEQGGISGNNVKALCDQIKEDEQLAKLPARVYTSAILMVSYTFKSWFEVQKKLRLKIQGKQEWLTAMQADLELAQSTDFSPEVIHSRAAELLLQAEGELEQEHDQGQSGSMMTLLFKGLKVATAPLDQRAYAHLLRNSCKVNPDEDPEHLPLRLEKKS